MHFMCGFILEILYRLKMVVSMLYRCIGIGCRVPSLTMFRSHTALSTINAFEMNETSTKLNREKKHWTFNRDSKPNLNLNPIKLFNNRFTFFFYRSCFVYNAPTHTHTQLMLYVAFFSPPFRFVSCNVDRRQLRYHSKFESYEWIH